MRVVVYGGSFNPPHVAHAMVASWLIWTKKADKVLLVPVYRHPFEGIHSKTLASYERRLNWCRLMANELNLPIDVSDIEKSLPSPSFTIDTLKELSLQNPHHAYRLVIGADVLPELPKWKDWHLIEEQFSPILVGRNGFPCPVGAVSFPEVSSSAIREGLGENKEMGHFLTNAVYRDISNDNPWV